MEHELNSASRPSAASTNRRDDLLQQGNAVAVPAANVMSTGSVQDAIGYLNQQVNAKAVSAEDTRNAGPVQGAIGTLTATTHGVNQVGSPIPNAFEEAQMQTDDYSSMRRRLQAAETDRDRAEHELALAKAKMDSWKKRWQGLTDRYHLITDGVRVLKNNVKRYREAECNELRSQLEASKGRASELERALHRHLGHTKKSELGLYVEQSKVSDSQAANGGDDSSVSATISDGAGTHQLRRSTKRRRSPSLELGTRLEHLPKRRRSGSPETTSSINSFHTGLSMPQADEIAAAPEPEFRLGEYQADLDSMRPGSAESAAEDPVDWLVPESPAAARASSSKVAVESGHEGPVDGIQVQQHLDPGHETAVDGTQAQKHLDEPAIETDFPFWFEPEEDQPDTTSPPDNGLSARGIDQEEEDTGPPPLVRREELAVDVEQSAGPEHASEGNPDTSGEVDQSAKGTDLVQDFQDYANGIQALTNEMQDVEMRECAIDMLQGVVGEMQQHAQYLSLNTVDKATQTASSPVRVGAAAVVPYSSPTRRAQRIEGQQGYLHDEVNVFGDEDREHEDGMLGPIEALHNTSAGRSNRRPPLANDAANGGRSQSEAGHQAGNMELDIEDEPPNASRRSVLDSTDVDAVPTEVPRTTADPTNVWQSVDQLLSMLAIGWNVTDQEHRCIRNTLFQIFSTGAAVEKVVAALDKHAFGPVNKVAQYPPPCIWAALFGSHASAGGKTMTQQSCKFCSSRNGFICGFAKHLPGIASGFGTRGSNGTVPKGTGRKYDANAQPRTISVDGQVNGRAFRWVLKKRKAKRTDPDDTDFQLGNLTV